MRFIGRCVLGNRWRAAGVGVLTAGLLLSGCAYFNTFYHARKFYNEAERKRKDAEEQGRPAGDAHSLYEQSIKKCAKIIVEHPNSKWVDDALLMMGNGFYYREEYARAIRKYDELITYYPESPFADEARWMSALAHFELGNVEEARTIFRQVAGGPEDSKRKARATVMLARSWEADGKYKRCISEVEDVFGSGDDSGATAGAFLVLGDCYRKSGDLASAIRMYERAAARSADRVERFEAELRVAEGLTDLGKLEEAQGFYETLMDKESNLLRQAKLRLAMGHLLVKRGDAEEGIEMFRRVADDPLVQALPGDAQFQIGLAYEKNLGNLEEAVKAYEGVAQKRPPREIGEEAGRRKDNVTRTIGYLAQREEASPDSVPVLDFVIAEHYLFSIGDTSKALEHYEAVADDSTNATLSAKSLLAVAWIRGQVDKDSTAALGLYEELVTRYPETDYADKARVVLGLPPRPKPEPVDTLNVLTPDVSAAGDSVGFDPEKTSAPADSLFRGRMPRGSERRPGAESPPDSPQPALFDSTDTIPEDTPEPAPPPDPKPEGAPPDSLMRGDPLEELSPSMPPHEEDHDESAPDSL